MPLLIDRQDEFLAEVQGVRPDGCNRVGGNAGPMRQRERSAALVSNGRPTRKMTILALSTATGPSCANSETAGRVRNPGIPTVIDRVIQQAVLLQSM